MNSDSMLCVDMELTANNNRDGVLLEVGAGHHDAREDPLVFECSLFNVQVELFIDADPLGITICSLNGGLGFVCLFDQQIPCSTIIFLLQRETTEREQR